MLLPSARRGLTRGLSTRAGTPSTNTGSTPLVELREYSLVPAGAGVYVEATNKILPTRVRNLPLRTFTLPDTGGALNVATHTYFYEGGHAQRDASRAAQQLLPEWQQYLQVCRPHVAAQSSKLFTEASGLVSRCGLSGMASAHGPGGPRTEATPSVIFEIRRYQLKLGYDTVPQFLALLEKGLPSKLTAPGTDPTTSLATVLAAEVGTLNEVIEVWRHGGGTGAMQRSREAARGALPWREAVNAIAALSTSFTSAIHKPIACSQWK